ncbi:hypothetical protein [Elongatibacter sediminis]|uniref:Secreted protein n=1 Tax=Elongatibacter sediminis TaxID=3119006 RepID=A0AAW9RCU3_9GAMM
MLHFKRQRYLRVPHQVAVLTALILLVTAWTADPPEDWNEQAAAPATAAGLEQNVTVSDVQESTPDGRTESPMRFSLMLFRFN